LEDALFKFRQEFMSISSKNRDKICFEGRFSNGGDQWSRVPSEDFGGMMKLVKELRIRVWREQFNPWQ
jgi:hypothetical protein